MTLSRLNRRIRLISPQIAILMMALVLLAGTSCIFEQPPSPPVEPTDSTDETQHAQVIDDDQRADGESIDSPMVVLVHGLGRTHLSMLTLEWSLERAGYQVYNWGYSSTCCSVEELGQQLADELHALEGPRPAEIHYVGHSLGNIIIRWMLSHDAPLEPGRVVMLAPPNHGAATADRYVEWFGWLLEPLDDLVTEDGGTARELSLLENREVGVIAGQYDGKVSVEETRLEAHDDHEIVGSAHTFIMNRPEVHTKVESFLDDGEF